MHRPPLKHTLSPMRVIPETGLPEPDAESAQHAAKVAAALRDVIGDGSISFAEFMQRALYEPGLGYYVAGNRKFGPAGDFVTAPEVSDLFGHVVATQCATVLQSWMAATFWNPGQGSGALAAVSVIAAAIGSGRVAGSLSHPGGLTRVAGASGTANPGEQVPSGHSADRVRWIDADVPENFTGVIIANEVADAIPVERFRIADGEIQQARVIVHGDRFEWSV